MLIDFLMSLLLWNNETLSGIRQSQSAPLGDKHG